LVNILLVARPNRVIAKNNDVPSRGYTRKKKRKKKVKAMRTLTVDIDLPKLIAATD
jgi:hypothetical protein